MIRGSFKKNKLAILGPQMRIREFNNSKDD